MKCKWQFDITTLRRVLICGLFIGVAAMVSHMVKQEQLPLGQVLLAEWLPGVKFRFLGYVYELKPVSQARDTVFSIIQLTPLWALGLALLRARPVTHCAMLLWIVVLVSFANSMTSGFQASLFGFFSLGAVGLGYGTALFMVGLITSQMKFRSLWPGGLLKTMGTARLRTVLLLGAYALFYGCLSGRYGQDFAQDQWPSSLIPLAFFLAMGLQAYGAQVLCRLHSGFVAHFALLLWVSTLMGAAYYAFFAIGSYPEPPRAYILKNAGDDTVFSLVTLGFVHLVCGVFFRLYHANGGEQQPLNYRIPG